ncbi:MAG: heavy metal translocating P-type ATPase [Acutalibacteraceae bacterium]
MSSQKKQLIRIIAAAVFFAAGIVVKQFSADISFIIFLVSLVIGGADVFISAVKNIFKGQVFDENFLMSIAAVGAFIIGECPEGAAVMLFYQVGELFQDYAVDKSRKSVSSLMDIRPDFANVKHGEEISKEDPYDVQVGDTIVIKPGERVPLDAVITSGFTTLDTSSLTGESLPREKEEGDEILSGSINLSGLIEARVTKEYEQSTVSKILDLVENAADSKATSESFITRFAKYYTPAVVIAAVLLAFVPPIFAGFSSLSDWVYRALTFLVISCPCALVISVPLSFFSGIGASSKNGVLVKGSNHLEQLAKAKTVVFDKTGTLTKGVFKVSRLVTNNCSESELLETAAYIESCSNHPISVSVTEEYGKEIDKSRISDCEEKAGHGVTARIDGKVCAAGNLKLMRSLNIEADETATGTAVHVSRDGKYLGYILIEDEIKPDAETAIEKLKALGIKKTVMLTGDSKTIAEKVAEKTGIDEFHAELLPADKVSKTEEMIKSEKKNEKLVFVGDGINDAPVLALSDIGIAMGGLGSDAAIEASDIVIMTDEPSKISTAIKISAKTLRIVKQNIFFALFVKFAVLILGALGIAHMWAAVFADVGVSVIAILNALRILGYKE